MEMTTSVSVSSHTCGRDGAQSTRWLYKVV